MYWPLSILVLMTAALNPAEKTALRMWFTYLAEAQYYVEPERRPKEISDCSSLVRYAFREAQARHDAEWRKRNPLPGAPGLPAAPLRTGPLFETPAGLAHFADAKTLMRRNCRRVGSDLGRARPGDLLFYEQPNERENGERENWHVMIYLGESQMEAGGGPWVLYHTGPAAGTAGEMRRLSVTELRNHPQARWRPVAGNGAFHGVYRWKVLED